MSRNSTRTGKREEQVHPQPGGVNWFVDAGSEQTDPVTMREVVQELLKEISPTVRGKPAMSLRRLERMWNEVVGEELTRWTRVVRYRGGVLTVEVDSSPLLAELSGFAREGLLEHLAAQGLEGIHELKFKPGAMKFDTSPGGCPSPEGNAE